MRLAENGCLLDRLKENRANPYVNVGNKKATFTETDKVKIARDVANGMLHLSSKVVSKCLSIMMTSKVQSTFTYKRSNVVTLRILCLMNI